MPNEWVQQKSEPFSVKARLKSFAFAWNGVKTFFNKEHNAQLHLASTIIVVTLAFFFRISAIETLFLVFAIGFVWVAEMINTAIEKIMDFITIEKHEQIKFIKDVAAGAVLVASLIACVIGAIIFIPKLLLL